MKLFLLLPAESFANDYDCAQGFVIRAESEANARAIAASCAGDEQPLDGHLAPLPGTGWYNPTSATCTELTANGLPELLLRSFRHG